MRLVISVGSRKDISDLQVLDAYRFGYGSASPLENLMRFSGQPRKVCLRAMERAVDRGLIDYGVSLDTGWLTDKGKLLLAEDLVQRLRSMQ